MDRGLLCKLYAESMKYGNDVAETSEICDVTDIFRGSDFAIFAQNIEKGAVVRAVPGPKCGSRAIADRMNSWAQGEGVPVRDISYTATGSPRPGGQGIRNRKAETIRQAAGVGDGDAVFFACAPADEVANFRPRPSQDWL